MQDEQPAASTRPPPGHNRLANETSAYLRQHMTNPVDWYPWGEEALRSARERTVPLLVSIGYSACHWCHVMEHESFEDPETAALMNELFVAVKVDREERPDVDQIYMDTVIHLSGHGGWPLTVFCTPDGRPFHGGTYYPKEARYGMPSFQELLRSVDRTWRERRGDVDQATERILAALDRQPEGQAEHAPGARSVAVGAHAIMQAADSQNGGFGTAPKFPTPTNLELLQTAADFVPEAEAAELLEHVRSSCIEMARRGLFDHLGGGFHRYCVDATWTIPHFEKMLYDQGLLLRVYAEMCRRGREDEELAWPMRETIEYLRREMTAPEGGFYASQDADSEGEEGKFFVWTPTQVEAVLGETAAAFRETYGVTEAGNFEQQTTHLVDLARKPRDHLSDARSKLFRDRAYRVPPATDRKRVAAWNGYAISGLARASTWLDEPSYLDDAVRAADFVLEHMRDERGRLLRVFNEGQARVSGFLDDVASLLDACLDLYRAGGGERFLAAASGFADDLCERFFGEAEGDFFLTPSDGERLAHRPRSDHDGATPESRGLATLGLVRMGEIAARDDLRRIAQRVFETHAYKLEHAPYEHPTLLRGLALATRGMAMAVIVGDPEDPACQALARAARRRLAPEDCVAVVRAAGETPPGLAQSWVEGREPSDGRAAAFVCHGTRCSLPVTDPAQLDDLQSLLPS
jgi:uncharacterized protein YyaL (SSP411 family)